MGLIKQLSRSQFGIMRGRFSFNRFLGLCLKATPENASNAVDQLGWRTATQDTSAGAAFAGTSLVNATLQLLVVMLRSLCITKTQPKYIRVCLLKLNTERDTIINWDYTGERIKPRTQTQKRK